MPSTRRVPCLFLLGCVALLHGCGGGGGGSSTTPVPTTPPPPVVMPDFQLAAVPQVTMAPATALDVQVTVSPTGGFLGNVQISASGLPQGISSSPIVVSVTGTSAASGLLHLTAAPKTQLGNATLSIQASSGTLSHSVQSQLSVLSAGAVRPFIALGGVPFQAFVDNARQLLFVTNPGLNEVDVLSSTSFTLLKRINLTEPIGIDQMSDGHTLVIGTDNQSFYTLDENTFVASRHFPPFDTTFATTWENLFWFPHAQPNGKVLFVTSTANFGNGCNNDYAGDGLYSWDSATDAIALITSPAQFQKFDAFGHSGDHRFDLFESCGELQFYDSSSGRFTVVPDFYASMVAVNNDGSQYAVLDTQLSFFDSHQQKTGQISIPNFFFISSTLMYNADGTRLYIEGNIGYSSKPMLLVIDPKAQNVLGYLSLSYGNTYGVLLAAGPGNDIYVGGYGGVGYVDTSAVYSLTGSGIAAGSLSPDSAPLNTQVTASQSTASYSPGTVATVNGLPAVVTNTNSLIMTLPASANPGPANIVVTQPDGLTFVFPDLFAYGLSLEGFSATLLPDSTATWLNLYGYGLLPGGAAASVSIAGTPAQTKVPNGYVVSGALEFQFVSAPPLPPSTVDVSVSNPNGSATLVAGLTYVHDKILPTAQPPAGVTIDNQRNVVYVLDGSRIDVLDVNTLSWLTPITIANAAPSAQLSHLALDSSGKILAIDGANAVLYRIDPANPSIAVAIPLTVRNIPNAPPQNASPLAPYKVFALPNQQAIVTITNWYTAIIDLNTGSLRYTGDIGYLDLYPLPNGTDILGARGGITTSYLFSWNLPTDTFRQILGTEASSEVLESSHDGSTFATTGKYGYLYGWGAYDKTVLLDSTFHTLKTVAYPPLGYPSSPPLFTVKFSPQDKVLVIVRSNEVDFAEVATGHLLQRFATPEPLYTPPYTFVFGSAAVLDSTGTKLFLTSASGVTVVQFASSIDNMQPYQWRFQSRPPVTGNAQAALAPHYVRRRTVASN